MAAHKKPNRVRALLAGATGVSTVAVALTVGGGSPASAATTTTWDKVADCESSGNWEINTGNGFYGGLQFTRSTWLAYRLPGYPDRADHATRAQQIRVAERVLAAQGPRAWPVCGPRAGLARGQAAPQLRSQAAPAAPRSAPAAPSRSRAAVAVAYATSKISTAAYLWGGNGPVHFDCSGLTSQAWRAAGVHIPRTAQGQLQGLPRVSLSSVRPGDLVIYSFSSFADHVALYVGNGKTVDTASHHPNGGVGYSVLHRAGGTIAGVVRPAGPTAAGSAGRGESVPVPPRVESAPAAPVAASGTHTVVLGDWLSKIARRYGTTWRTLYALNRDKISDPDLIYPGQVLRLPASASGA